MTELLITVGLFLGCIVGLYLVAFVVSLCLRER